MGHSGSEYAVRDLEAFLKKAAWRLRLERFRLAVGIMIRLLLIGAVIWTVAIYFDPKLALGVPVGVILAAVLLFITADVALFWNVDRRSLLVRLDRQFGLADGALTADELLKGEENAWRAKQLSHTLTALAGRKWDEHWSRKWPRYTGLASACLVVFGTLLFHCHLIEKAAAEEPLSPFLQSQYQALEEVFKDWELAQQEVQDPELQKLLEELKPLREKLQAGEIKEADVLAQLSRLEDKLEAARKALEAQSLEPFAADLAAAFEPIAGMSATASALRRKDFGQAEQRAGEMADKLAQDGAQLPEGAKSAANQNRIAKLAQSMSQRGNEGAGQSLQQMQQAMKSGDTRETSNALRNLQMSFGKQAKRDADKQRLRMQLAQMGQCKECLGSGSSLCQGMSLIPKLAMQKKPGGKGAGSETDPNRFGAETQIASTRREEQLSGALGAGDSEIQTETSMEQNREAVAGARQASFRQYEKLSQEAIENEDIPLAHRQSIRKYFELIRPSAK